MLALLLESSPTTPTPTGTDPWVAWPQPRWDSGCRTTALGTKAYLTRSSWPANFLSKNALLVRSQCLGGHCVLFFNQG